MADPYNGIWIINKVTRQLLVNDWFTYVPPPSIPTLNYGYYMGGYSPTGGINNIDRLDYSNDTTDLLDRADLVDGRGYGFGVANDIYAWSAGGQMSNGPSATSRIDRYSFASDTTNAIANGNLTQIKSDAAGTTNGTYGWSFAGWSGGPVNIIERIDFSTSPVTILDRADTTVAKVGCAGLSNNINGWICGGNGSNTIERMSFASDTMNSVDRSDLTYGRTYFGGVGNNTYGWLGGEAPGPVPNDIDRLTFVTDTINAIGRAVSNETLDRSRGSSGPAYGYWGGGFSYHNSIQRYNFSDDTSNTIDRGDLNNLAAQHHSVQDCNAAF